MSIITNPIAVGPRCCMAASASCTVAAVATAYPYAWRATASMSRTTSLSSTMRMQRAVSIGRLLLCLGALDPGRHVLVFLCILPPLPPRCLTAVWSLADISLTCDWRPARAWGIVRCHQRALAAATTRLVAPPLTYLAPVSARTAHRAGGGHLCMRYVFGDCTLDTELYIVQRTELTIPLRPKVFQVLHYLLCHRERVISKQELQEQVWPDQFVSDAALEGVLKAVRQAVGDSRRTQWCIQTRRGQGYRFVAPLVEPGGTPQPAEDPAVSPDS